MPFRDFGWRYDLPSPQSPSQSESITGTSNFTPNYFNEYFIELPRSTLKIRGYWLVSAPVIFILTLCLYIFYSPPLGITDLESIIIDSFIFVIGVLLASPYIRMDIGFPRDEPIRFNRYRRKVYFYQYRYNRLHPFGRKNWGVQPVAYDWADLNAEVYRIYLPMGYGGLKEWISLSVRKPGTDEVIDRLFLTDSIEKGEQYWATVRLFMQEGPQALRKFFHSPEDSGELPNPSPWRDSAHCNPFDRLAPKVQWPAEMDLESRTAPRP